MRFWFPNDTGNARLLGIEAHRTLTLGDSVLHTAQVLAYRLLGILGVCTGTAQGSTGILGHVTGMHRDGLSTHREHSKQIER